VRTKGRQVEPLLSYEAGVMLHELHDLVKQPHHHWVDAVGGHLNVCVCVVCVCVVCACVVCLWCVCKECAWCVCV